MGTRVRSGRFHRYRPTPASPLPCNRAPQLVLRHADGLMQMEQRRHQRRKIEAPIRVWGIASDSTRAIHGHCFNLSEGGAGAIIAGPWQPGQVVTVQLTIPRGADPIMVEARLSHRNRIYCGFEFLGTNEMVMSQLRNACAEA